MVLPSKAVVQDIKNLIRQVTGFGEDEENFYICEQYCLSHVMHHSYPSVNRSEVKKNLDAYIHRFYVHGYFKVSDALDDGIKKFLSNENLFKKNPQSDIQWILLSLLYNLATNLTQVAKLPKMLPINDEEKPIEEIDWGQYLKEGLPTFDYHDSGSSSGDSNDEDVGDDDMYSCTNSDTNVTEFNESTNPILQEESRNGENESDFDVSSVKTFTPSRQHIIDDLVRRREYETSYSRDVVLRGNFVKQLAFFNSKLVPFGTEQILSEFELIGYILKQFLTGDNILKRKGIINPSTCSLTSVTINSYLAVLWPYMNMIKIFKDFIVDVTFLENQTSHFYTKSSETKKKCAMDFDNSPISETTHNKSNKMNSLNFHHVPNVVKLYKLALIDVLRSFENKILTISEYQHSYTLLKVLYELRPSFSDLRSLFAVHLSATRNWLKEPNWLRSIRILTTLYKAMINSTSNRMGFLYMNMFLYCFQSYLDITDRWISCLCLNDPNDEYIIYKSETPDDSGTNIYPYKIRPYREKLSSMGIKEIKILDYLANKLIHVGHSIDVLYKLDRSLIHDQNEPTRGPSEKYLYLQLLNKIKEDFKKLAESATRTSVSKMDKGDCSEINGNFEDDHKSFNKFKDETDLKEFALSEFCMEICEDDGTRMIEKSIWPIGIIIESNLKIILDARVVNTCDLAKDIVVNVFKLKTHLRLLRNIFLFNEPHLIQPFLCAMTQEDKMWWRNGYALTVHLRECLEYRYGNQAQLLSVSVGLKRPDVPNGILDIINKMTINYQMDWPLQLIFTPKIMGMYNDIFRNLFKLHLAHQALCKLRFRDTKTDGTADIVKSSRQRIELLRFWCMSSLGRLRSYFMALISTPFDLQISSYQHLTHIYKAHEEFISKIHTRCLLDDNQSGKKLIFDVFIPLCFDVHQCWTSYEIVPDCLLTPAEAVFFEFQKKFPHLMAELEKD